MDIDYICIEDIYFEHVNENCYIVSEDDLKRLQGKIKMSEYDKKFTIENIEKRLRIANRKIKHYQTLAHTYKIEMNRYRRKLTRIYKFFKLAYYEAFLRHIKSGLPKKYVDAVDKILKEVKNV